MMRRLLLLLLFAAPLFGQGTQIQSGPTNPATCKAGAFFYNTGTLTYYQCGTTPNTWVAISSGGGGGPTIQTNGTNNTSQTVLNFVTSTTNAAGLTVTPSNPSSGNEIMEVTGTTNVTSGGTGVSNPTSHTVPIAEGSSAMTFITPGTSGLCMISNGTGADPSFQNCPTQTTKPAVATSILYVAPTCNGNVACSDANDGLSWGSAKLTIYAALQALPFGATGKAGVGTIYVADGSSANPTSGAGIWLMASADPNFASPPTGWLQCDGPTCVPTIIGSPAGSHDANPHMGRALVLGGNNSDNNHPALWLSGQQVPVHIKNLSFGTTVGRSMVIGECSNNTRTSLCNVAGSTFENVGGEASGTASSGPCLDITGGSYWLWFRDFSCSGNVINATGGSTANNAAAILIDGTGNNGNGLITITDTNLANGGIKVIPGGTSPGPFYFEGISEEGDFTHNMPPVVWFTSAGVGVTGIVSHINLADPGPSPTPAVQNDGDGRGLVLSEILGGAAPNIQGGGVVLAQTTSNFLGTTISPRSYGQVGFFNNYMIGETDSARRLAGLTPNRSVNIANNNSATWTTSNVSGTQTITPGILDPFGGTTASTVSSTATATESVTLGGCPPYTPTVGDWIIGGMWVQGSTPGNTNLALTCTGFGIPTFSSSFTNNGLQQGNASDWQFIWTAGKYASTLVTHMALTSYFSSSGGTYGSRTIYGPVLYIIPAGTLSDNEVLELVANMNSVDNSCAVGSICNVAGHPVSVWGAPLILGEPSPAPTGSLSQTDLYEDPTSHWLTFKPNGNTAYSVAGFSATPTNNLLVCTSGTSGGLTTSGCPASGMVNPMTTLGDIIYENATPAPARLAGPTGPNSVAETLTSTPSAGVAQAPVWGLPGVLMNPQTGTTYTVLATDRLSYLSFSNAGAIAVTLPQAGSTGFASNFDFVACDIGAGTATITPTTSTISFSTGSAYTAAASSMTITTGQCAWIYSDNTNYFAIRR